MRKYNTKRHDDFDLAVTPPGSHLHTNLSAQFDGKTTTLVPTGVTDTAEIINSYAPYCDLNYMLHQLACGDMTHMSQKKPMFGDFSGLPNNPIDVINLVQNAESQFGQLSEDAKKRYNNDFRVWLAQMFAPGSHLIPDRKEVLSDDGKPESVSDA